MRCDKCGAYAFFGQAAPDMCPFCEGSDECDECDGSGTYYIDGEPQKCICTEPQE